MSEQVPEAPEDEGLSSDARFATYEEAPRTEEDDAYPPSGGGTIQTKGKPTETAAKKTAGTRETKETKS